jgi:hypothetical protein
MVTGLLKKQPGIIVSTKTLLELKISNPNQSF